ncbi:MAG: zinc ribbon domain-containing protein [bacterium]
MFKCNYCGCGITAEHHTKYIKAKNKVKGYDYYHCTHKKKTIVCRQGSVEEKEITKNITKKLEKLEMHPLFLQWSLDYLDSQKSKTKQENKVIDNSRDDKVKELESNLSELTMMRARGLLDDDEFLKEKKNLKKQVEKFNSKDSKQKTEEEIIELTKEKFIFSAYALKKFKDGDKTKKKQVLNNLGSNRVIEDKKVLITVNNWLLPIYDNAQKLNAKMRGLEPLNFGLTKRKNEALTSLNLSWLGHRDSNFLKPYIKTIAHLLNSNKINFFLLDNILDNN